MALRRVRLRVRPVESWLLRRLRLAVRPRLWPAPLPVLSRLPVGSGL
ncbi:hypothetical protein [Streptomyces thermolilacinus]|nr:hypothetical protein [Streptomyces thermolilacinus]